MTETIEEKLKREVNETIQHVEYTRNKYLEAKEDMKRCERQLKIAKSQFNNRYRNWVNARLKAVRAKRRVYSVPYRIRKWALEHLGKALELNE